MGKSSGRSLSLLSLIGWLLVALFLWQTLWGVTRVLSHVNLALGNSSQNFEDIFRGSLQISYRFVQFIQNETPEHSILLLPAAAPRTYLFFLYPRQVYFGDEQTLRAHPEIEYVVVDYGFSDFPVAGEKIPLDDGRGLIKVAR